MPAKLRCFVAMAFGQKDTDAIFKILRKTLAPLGINAQRVDRIEHNDNIDTRIISEIEAADLHQAFAETAALRAARTIRKHSCVR